MTANGLSLIQLARADGLHPFERATGTAVLYSLIGVGLPTLIAIALLGQTWLGLAAALVVGAVLYPSMIWRARQPLHVEQLIAAVSGGRR